MKYNHDFEIFSKFPSILYIVHAMKWIALDEKNYLLRYRDQNLGYAIRHKSDADIRRYIC